MKKCLLFLITLLIYTGDIFCSPVYSIDDSLPSWFYSPYAAVGVSDMYLDKEVAVNQAVIRALYTYALSEDVNISSVYELYYHIENGRRNSVDDQKSHCFVEFETELVDYDYEIVDVFYTKYDEAVVLLNVSQGNDDGMKRNARFNGSCVFYFDGTIRYPEYGDLLRVQMITPDENIKSLEWLARTENSTTTIYSTTDGESERLLEKYYVYGNNGIQLKNAVYQNTKHGVWHCLSDTYMQALTNFIPYNSLVCSTNRIVSDYQGYNDNSEYKDKVQDMVRRIYSTKVHCEIAEIATGNGNIYVNWDIIEHVQPDDYQHVRDGEVVYEVEGTQAVVGADYSKAKNESKRIAMISAQNEIAKMSNFLASSTAIDFSMTENEGFYERYCDTAQISTIMMLKGVKEIIVADPELNNGVFHAKIKTAINPNNIVPIKR